MTLVHWAVSTVAILIAAYLVPGVHVTPVAAIVLAVVLGLINIFIKPIITIVTLPLTILTLGLFSLVINACLILLSAYIVPGFSVDSFWWALLFSIVLSLINALFSRLV